MSATTFDDGGYDFRTIAAAMKRAEPAERYAAGCVFLSADAADRVRDELRSDQFTHHAYRLVFDLAAAMRAAGERVDLGLFLARAAAAGRRDDFGPDPVGFLTDLIDEPRTPANLPAACAAVRDYALLRGLYHLATELARDSLSPTDPPDVLAEAYARKLAGLIDGRPGVREPEPIRAAVHRAVARYDALGTAAAADGLLTGLDALDDLTGGFRPGRLYVVAGRPGGGKSVFGSAVTVRVARAGHPALVITLEMPTDENVDRMMSATAGVPGHVLQGRTPLARHDADRVCAQLADDGLAGLSVHFDDAPAHTPASVAAVVRRAVRRHRVEFVVVDYLQLLKPDNPKDPRYLQVGDAAKSLKRLARELGVAVLCLAQMNREVEGRKGGEPQLSDLRDSGEIEQDADFVGFLHRLTDDPRQRVQDIDLVVRKQRNGPVGKIGLAFDQPLVRFQERGPTLA